ADRRPPRAAEGARGCGPGAHARGAAALPRGLRRHARGLREAPRGPLAMRAAALIVAFAVGLPGTLAARAVALTDDLGRGVALEAPARRIVTLAPFLTELAFSAGAGDRVVGVSAHSDFPAAARGLPQVASSAGLALEGLLALEP